MFKLAEELYINSLKAILLGISWKSFITSLTVFFVKSKWPQKLVYGVVLL